MKWENKNFAQRKAKDFNIFTRLYQYYALYILFMPFFGTLFYKFNFIRNNKIDKKKNYIVAPNHVSYLDVFIVNFAAQMPLAYMAKQELFKTDTWKHRYIAKNIWRLGAFSVNREKVALSTIKIAKEALKAKYNLCIFPQGGIRKNRTIENINEGFIYFAKTAKLDILPIIICNMEEYNWTKFKRKQIDVYLGEPISYKLDDKEILNNWAEQVCKYTGYENKITSK